MKSWKVMLPVAVAVLLASSASGHAGIPIPDPVLSSVVPWDDYGQVAVSPGEQSSFDEITVTVIDQLGNPYDHSFVEIYLIDCETVCVEDGDDNGMTGTTGPDGKVTLNPHMSGCEDCLIRIAASGIFFRNYGRVVSTDWDGSISDGAVTPADFAFFATAFKQTQDLCADYNGDGLVSGTDFAAFATSFIAGDANDGACR